MGIARIILGLWRGIATDTLSSDPQKNSKKIDKALTKIFQKFPPQ